MVSGPSVGLRTRLSFAFALLCVVTAAAVAGGTYVQARTDRPGPAAGRRKVKGRASAAGAAGGHLTSA
ncbi:hypothetical protein E1292_02785 [Nonomuraea deserti]|uniref:Uncharacterized protein n=1 Tax=Nonomuraea deserti TaxID=1848322 RepID=A0A4R4W0S2_9ACTN|nr:hypothetical protein E1292_02785 [Nonomuraea deserti]